MYIKFVYDIGFFNFWFIFYIFIFLVFYGGMWFVRVEYILLRLNIDNGIKK